MKIFQFNKNLGKKISHYNSDFIMSRIIQTDKVTRVGCMYLEEKGDYRIPSSGCSSTSFNNERRGNCTR